MYASKNNYSDMVELLINNNADLKVTDSDGWTAYGLAATSGNYQTLDLLIKKGVNPNTRNSSSTTVLMLACKSGNVPTIQILIKNGALLNLKDKFGKSASLSIRTLTTSL